MSLLVQPYQRPYQGNVLDLMFYARRTHTHLDWYRLMNWLDLPGNTVLTAWDHGRLLGMIGLSPSLHHTQWIRVMGIDNGSDADAVLGALWQAVIPTLAQQAVQQVGLMVIQPWMQAHLPALGFTYSEDVITMERTGLALAELPTHPYIVQNAYREMVDAMLAVDHAAFAPPWQLSREEIRQAQRQVASCTVVMVAEDIVGYQVTTRQQGAAHLARLAVHPRVQGQGVGGILLHEMVAGMARRSVRSITVNTQISNTRSQHLYTRFGFARNGYDLPVWFWRG